MQNKIQYSSSNQYNNVYTPTNQKFNTENSTTVVDATQPSNSSTHHSSYPNLNFDFPNSKPTHAINSDRTNVVPTGNTYNSDFRNHQNSMNYGFNNNNQKGVRPNRGN